MISPSSYAVAAVAAIALALPLLATRPAGADLLQQTWLPVPAGRVNHAPGIIELPSGQLLGCWYSGSQEANPDIVILCATSGDAGAT